MIKGDLHVHTSYSDGAEDPIKMIEFSIRKRLGIIAITDHDTNRGYFKITSFYGKAKLKELGVIVVPGVEISTYLGHIVVLGVDVPIELGNALPRKSSIVRLLEKLRDKFNAIIILAHPYSCKGLFTCASTKDETILSLVNAVEAINGRSVPKKNIDALVLARKLGKVCVAGSDAHELRELGVTYTIFPDNTNSYEDVLNSIEQGIVKLGPIPKATKVIGNIFVRYLNQFQRFSLKITGYMYELH